MSKKLILPLALIIALVIFAGCGAATGVLKHGPVPSDQAATKLLPAALAENNWKTTTSNGLSPDEAAVGDYGNFKVFAVKNSSPEDAAKFIEQGIATSEDCSNCTRDSLMANGRGYLKYRGPDLDLTLAGEKVTGPFMIWNNGLWIFAVENTGSEDFRDSAAEAFAY